MYQQGYTDVARYMTENLTDHNPRSSLGKTPLQLAALIGNISCVKILVVRSALNDPRNMETGKTPIDLARQGNHSEVVEFLLTQQVPRS